MLEWELDDGIAVITIDHPPVNALDLELLEAFPRCLGEVEAAAPRAAILTGSGSVFSAGADLLRVLQEGESYIRRAIPHLAETFRSIFTFPRPLVAAVNGHAIAGGAVIACACDHRIAVEDGVKIGFAELRVGVPFPADALEIVRHVTGPRFEEVVLSGRNYGVDDALDRGLVDAVVSPSRLMDAATEAAERLARIPIDVYRLNKIAMRGPVIARIESYRVENDAAAARLWASEEVRDAIRRFLETL
ncbi:MAG: enoyl-CoA hydratase/isomerase family protein [Actinomycetota bacterium]